MLGQWSYSKLMDGAVITETIIFVSYILVCAALFKSRFSRAVTGFAFGVAGAAVVGVNIAIMLSGTHNLVLMLTLLPLTAYLPFSVLLYFLSDSGIFETAAVCAVGMLEVLVLQSLHKIVESLCWGIETEMPRYVIYIIVNAAVVLAAAGLVSAAFQLIGRPFRLCVVENRQNRLLLLLPIALVFLMVFYFLNSATNITVLFLTTLTAVSVFFIIARLLGATAEIVRMQRSEKEMSDRMELQRRSYDRLARKMEAGRVYRHDMRHHLRIIEGLARQGDCGRIIEYTGKMNGSLKKIENVERCKNPEINAVLSEYISRAENSGCRITESFALPAKLPFAEDDVCIVLANAVENAINACVRLPREERYINISAEWVDNRRLLVSVKNPCADALVFDENGLPVVDRPSEEHGVGLGSVNRIAEKYNGFLRCRLEDGEFVFHAALFCGEDIPVKERERPGSRSRRAASSLICLGLGMLFMLNMMPSVAEAASSLLPVKIRTIRDLALGWGDNSITVESPEFAGNGAEELNGAVKNYTDEAKEKFLWYFNRRYNGYVAEDMTYTVIRDDEKYFTAQFNVTVNAGGSMDYGRWIVFDKSAGKVLELADMFQDGSDYIGRISAEIREQMLYKNEHENSAFFVEGDDAFTEISDDANFYIDSFDRIVIVFDEYEVAPGSMGSPRFFIPGGIIEDIVR